MAVSLRFAQGWTRPILSVLGIVIAFANILLLTHVIYGPLIGTAYTIWIGIGSVSVAMLGIILFGESMQPTCLACIGLAIVGTVGLNSFNVA